MPWSVVALALSLMALGCLAIARSEVLSDTRSRFITRQAIWVALCLAAMMAATTINYRLLMRWSYLAFGLSVGLLLVVFWCPTVNGAHRWIRFGPVGLQPSEFAKLAFVLALAKYLMYRDSYRTLRGLCGPLALVLVPMLLILKEPDLGTALVFMPVLFAMLYAAGARRGHLLLVMALAVATTPLLWSQMSREQKSRITALAEQTAPGERPTEDGYHLHRAKQVLALGGWTGNWSSHDAAEDLGAAFVPEAATDSIAVVLGERFGLIGWSVMLLLFWLLVWRSLAVAQSTRDPFGRLVAVGIGALLATQMLINTGMHLGLLPITGLTLPLVSYGGSSLLANSLALGLVLNIGLRPGYEVTAEPFRFAD